MERAILRRAAVAATALTFTLASATASIAGDCSSSKVKKSAMNETAVMGSAAYSSSTTYTSGTIIDAAVATPDLSTLTAAVTAAGLVDTLNGDGPFTVFAPTDDAFAALPAGTVDSLLLPENKDKLTAILTYHVVPGAVMSADLAGKRLNVATVNGETVHIDGTNGVTVNGATVVTADIVASNGVIHVIDSVLLP